jgi:Tfp pilus assembly protein PilF
VHDEATIERVEELAAIDLRLACEKARELVAADPSDKATAKLLTDLVRRSIAGVPPGTPSRPQLAEPVARAAQLIAAHDLENAERLLRPHLAIHRNDPPAMHLMAEIAARCGFDQDAERILRQSAALNSDSADVMTDLGRTLFRIACARNAPQWIGESLAALERAIAIDPAHEGALESRAEILMHIRELDAARNAYEALLAAHPNRAVHWMEYAYLLKTIGEFGRAVAAYRTAAALDPHEGATWWGLADLKRAKFLDEDISEMQSLLEGPGLHEHARIDIHMALAKALEDRGDYAGAARHLLAGNKLRFQSQPFDADQTTKEVDLAVSIFTPEFLKSREGWGDPRRGPIFIIGMPRSGSTLIEQILASHSQIEGTEELPILLQLAGELAHGQGGRQPDEVLAALEENAVRVLGGRYLEAARSARATDRPYFTDKHPSNWRYLGLILAMLPNAKVIDIRRNPMDCCFANYAQHFRAGADFTYDQRTLGRYYTDYVRLMRHFDEAAPGRVHRVIYEDLVDDLEKEVRGLLDYLDLAFEERMLEFHKTDRPVHTPSSEQVRQPINRSGIDRWQAFEPWLGPLKESLADSIDNWRR